MRRNLFIRLMTSSNTIITMTNGITTSISTNELYQFHPFNRGKFFSRQRESRGVILLPKRLSNSTGARGIQVLTMRLSSNFSRIIQSTTTIPTIGVRHNMTTSILVITIVGGTQRLYQISTRRRPHSKHQGYTRRQLRRLIIRTTNLISSMRSIIDIRSLRNIQLTNHSNRDRPLLKMLLRMSLFLYPRRLPLRNFVITRPLTCLHPRGVR